MGIRVLNAQQIIFGIVIVIGDVVVGIGDRSEPVRIVIGVDGWRRNRRMT